MAAPHVAGIVALLQQARLRDGLPPLAPGEVEDVLRRSAYPFENAGPTPGRHAGHGLADARAAIALALGLPVPPMSASLLTPTDDLRAFLLSGPTAETSSNAAAVADTGDDLARHAGLTLRFPPARLITPAARSIQWGAFANDAGGTPLLAAHPHMRVCGEATFEGSGRVSRACLAPFLDGVAFLGEPEPYTWETDDDVRLHLFFDLDGDGERRVEATVQVTYRTAPRTEDLLAGGSVSG